MRVIPVDGFFASARTLSGLPRGLAVGDGAVVGLFTWRRRNNGCGDALDDTTEAAFVYGCPFMASLGVFSLDISFGSACGQRFRGVGAGAVNVLCHLGLHPRDTERSRDLHVMANRLLRRVKISAPAYLDEHGAGARLYEVGTGRSRGYYPCT